MKWEVGGTWSIVYLLHLDKDVPNLPLLTAAHTCHWLGISSKHKSGSDNENAFSVKMATDVLTSWRKQLSSILLFNLNSFWRYFTEIELHMTTIAPGRSSTDSCNEKYILFVPKTTNTFTWAIPHLTAWMLSSEKCMQK